MESHVRIVHTESSTVMGGQERRVLAESLGMRDRGHDVWVATPPEGALANRAAAAGLEVVPMSFRRSLLPVNARAVGATVRRLQADVVNTHSSADSWTAAVARHLGPRAGALVRSRHISARVKPGPLHRFLYGQADFVITTGESVRRDLADSGLVPSERSVSIPTGVDLGRFRPQPEERAKARHSLGFSGDRPVLGVVAYLRPDKGHAVLLSAMPRILESHPSCCLVVVGDGPERVRLEAQAGRLGIEASVRFVGLREDVPNVLCALDAFCLPSVRNEGVPQSVLQASAVGLPVVSTAVGGIPEAVLDDVTGFVVPPADPALLAHALNTLISDPQLRRRFGEAGRRHVTAAFSVAHMLDLTEQAYATALQCAASRGRQASSASTGA
jgi:glycosyltransferase involved in cell wall biosynthesis